MQLHVIVIVEAKLTVFSCLSNKIVIAAAIRERLLGQV